MQAGFEACSALLFDQLKASERLLVRFEGEDSEMVRFNRAKVRQAGHVTQRCVLLTLVDEGRVVKERITLCESPDEDRRRLEASLSRLRTMLTIVEPDPLLCLPEPSGQSHEVSSSEGLKGPEAIAQFLQDAEREVRGADLVGFFHNGPVGRGFADSAGSMHWFSTEIVRLEWSHVLEGARALKREWGGLRWDQERIRKALHSAAQELPLLKRQPIARPPGDYRVWLAPAAHRTVWLLLSWLGLSTQNIKSGASPLQRVFRGEEELSPLLTVDGIRQRGRSPRFSDEGVLGPRSLRLIDRGRGKSSAVSLRAAREFDLAPNGGEETGKVDDVAIHPGDLPDREVLNALGTGIWVSNIWYLSFSDVSQGKVTGLTRYGCWWVENGVPIAPIETLRFDDHLRNFLGCKLERLGERADWVPTGTTYDKRFLGGCAAPGVLTSALRFTG